MCWICPAVVWSDCSQHAAHHLSAPETAPSDAAVHAHELHVHRSTAAATGSSQLARLAPAEGNSGDESWTQVYGQSTTSTLLNRDINSYTRLCTITMLLRSRIFLHKSVSLPWGRGAWCGWQETCKLKQTSKLAMPSHKPLEAWDWLFLLNPYVDQLASMKDGSNFQCLKR